jgi:zinc protease
MPVRSPRSILAALLAVVLSLATAGPASAAPGVPETKTFANGLAVVVLEDHSLPLVSVSLWVHAGSKDEIDTSAGYAHYLEHLVQRGTDTAGPFEYERLAHRWGGTLSVRAGYDRTSITATGVSSVLDQIVDAVAGMALRAKLEDKQIDQELVTLTQEVHKYYDEPSSVAFLEGMRSAFPKHPYRFPPLGNMKTIGALKHDALAAFYRNLYVPNNMALVLAGDLEPARARALAERAFGKAPKSATLPPRTAAPDGFAGHDDKEKPLDLKEPWTTLSFVGPGYRHPDRPAFEILARALGDAGGSRVLGNLVHAKSDSAAQVTYYRLEDAGLLYICMVPPAPEASYRAATAALEEVTAFKKRGLKENEVKGLVQGLLKEMRLEAERLDSLSEALGEAALFGGVRYYWDLPDLYGRVTAAEVNRVAAKYLVGENLRLVVIVPKASGLSGEEQKTDFHEALEALGGIAKDAPPPGFEKRLYADTEAARVRPDAWGDPRDAAVRRAPLRSSLDNGLTLVVHEDHRRALVAASLQLPFGSGDDPPGKEGLAYVASRFLSSTPAVPDKTDAPRVAENPAPPHEVQVSRDLTELRFLADSAGLRAGLSALAASVQQSGVDDGAFERMRAGAREALQRAADDPSLVALELFREKVYSGHPYAHASIGTPPGLASLTRADVEGFVKSSFRPAGAVLAIAGDVNPAEIQKVVRDLFGAWSGGKTKTPEASTRGNEKLRDDAAAGDPPAAGSKAAVAKPQDATVAPRSKNPANKEAAPGEFTRLLDVPRSSVLVGVPGPAITDPDFDDLRVLGAGLTVLEFEDVVFNRRAAFAASAVPEALRDGGSFAIILIAQHTRRDEALFDVQRQMRRLALEGLAQKDVDDFARVEAGREAAGLQGVLATASVLAYRQAAGLPSPETLPASRKLAPERLKDIASRYLDPGSWIVIKVGQASP